MLILRVKTRYFCYVKIDTYRGLCVLSRSGQDFSTPKTIQLNGNRPAPDFFHQPVVDHSQRMNIVLVHTHTHTGPWALTSWESKSSGQSGRLHTDRGMHRAPKWSELGRFGPILDGFWAPVSKWSEICRFGIILDGFRAPAPRWSEMGRFGPIFDGVRAPAPKSSEMGRFEPILINLDYFPGPRSKWVQMPRRRNGPTW